MNGQTRTKNILKFLAIIFSGIGLLALFVAGIFLIRNEAKITIENQSIVLADTSGTCGDNLTWTLDSNGVLTISGTGAMTDWTFSSSVPWNSSRSTINSVVIDDGVASIGNYAFYCCSSLTSVTIGNSVTSIGYWVFSDCSSLTSITVDSNNLNYSSVNGVLYDKSKTTVVRYPEGKTGNSFSIPSSVTSIGDSAFYGCSSLTSIEIPSSVTDIGNNAFRECSSLTSIEIPNGVTSIGGSAFSGCSSLTSVEIGNGVTSIGNSAFSGCISLTSIEIPSSVTDIGGSAFSYCRGLRTITLNEGLESIRSNAFEYCTNLRSITLPESLLSIGRNAFDHCNSIVSLNIPKNVTTIEVNIVSNCASLSILTVDSQNTTYNDGNGSNVIVRTSEGSLIAMTKDAEIPNNISVIGTELFSDRTDLTEIFIPYGITSIGNSAFSGCSSLTSINIPSSVTSIGGDAFSGCSSLTSVNIPSSVKSIGYSAFSGCSSLTSINIPSSVTYMGSPVFSGCSSLTSITVDNGNLYYISQDGVLYNNDKTTLIKYPEGKTGSYIIPNSVTSIGNRAFSGCNSLTSIEIPSGVTSIGNYAFYYCSSLTSITIPSSVTSIGEQAFQYCSSLTTINIPNSVTSIGVGAFYHCISLTSINIPSSVTDIGNNAFRECSSLTSIEIPNGVTSIGWGAFYGCSSLTSIIIPDGVTGIGESAFYGCRSLTSVTIGNGVTSIGYQAFYGCSSLTSINIPNSVTSIGDSAFKYCSSLTSIEIPSSVTSIGDSAFEYCSSLTSITVDSGNTVYNDGNGSNKIIKTSTGEVIAEGVYNGTCGPNLTWTIDNNGTLTIFGTGEMTSHPWAGNNIRYAVRRVIIENGVTSIGGHAFDGCSSLTSITIPSSVTSIGYQAFYGCSSLRIITVDSGNTVYNDGNGSNCIIETSTNRLVVGCKNTVIPSSVTSIETYAFSGCSDLTSITIPSSVTSIGGHAFDGCSSLTSINIPSSVTSIEWSTFSGCSSLTSINIPSSVTSIESSAFSYCSSLTSINIPSSVTSIESSAFYYCSSLTSITVDSGNTVYNDGNGSNCIIETSTNRLVVGCKNTVIPSSVTSIEDYAFYGRSSLTSITIPSSVTSIGYSAFYGCSSLTSIEIPSSVTSIGGYAFSGCSSLTSITIPGSVEHMGFNDRGGIFSNCSNLITVVIEQGVTSVEEQAFSGCSSLTSIEIPNSVTSIGGYAFSGCSSLTSIIIPNSVTSIEWYAFEGCNRLTSIEIPSSVTSIGEYAFRGCSSLISITIPGGMTNIENCVFSGCSSLTSIEIPSSVTSIGGHAFDGCSSLTSINIPSGVTSIGYSAFYRCSSLTSIMIPDGVTSIGDYAFCGCSSLTSIEIPSSVTSIETYAFSGCSSLTSIEIPNSVTSIEEQAFSGCSSLISIEIPNSVTSIGGYAFRGCSSLTSVSIGSGVTSIGYNAFSECLNSKIIFKSTTVPTIGSGAFGSGATNMVSHIFVPNEALEDYKTALPDYVSIIEGYDFEDVVTITWQNWDGTTLDEEQVAFANLPVYNSAPPTRTATAKYTYEWDGWTLPVELATEDATYTASFTRNGQAYTITYNSNDGTDRTLTQNVIYTGSFTTYNYDAFERNGYKIVGWSKDPNTQTGIYCDVNTYYGFEDTENITLYAMWSLEYSITYDLDGGTLTTENRDWYTEVTPTFTLNNPRKDYYNFTGWTGSNGSTPETTVQVEKGTTGNLTYTANWAPIEYTIDYILNDGTVTNPGTYTVESESFTLSNPTKEGYDFAGWTGTGLTDPELVVTILTGSYGNREYTATWAEVYSITYNLNGGSVSNREEYSAITETFTLNNPTKKGYTFLGWTGSNGENPQTTVTIPAGSTGNREYVANWEIITYTITTIVQGVETEQNYTVESASITLVQPTRAGATFKGWTGTNGTTPQKNITIAHGSTGDRTYTANWTLTNYTLKYTLYGGTVSPANPTKFNVETETFTLNNPTKANYDFLGWTGGGLTEPTLEVTIETGSLNNRTYVANWTPTEYTITYTLNGGTAENVEVYTVESNSITLVNPTKEGYNFVGWTGSNGETPQLSVIIPTGSTGNKEYTANWSEPIVYTITYTLNGGTATNPATYTVESESITLVNPTKAGYTFLGWTGSNGEEPSLEVVIPHGSTENRVYTANWSEAIVYTITYTLNGGNATNPATYTVESNSITLVNPTKAGYNFVGWTGSNGEEPSLEVVIPQGSTGNKVYTANWSEPIVYTITYTLNGGAAINSTSYTVESNSITFVNPTKVGYTFTGWIGSNGDEPELVVVIPQGSTGNKEYVANWSLNQYKIILHIDNEVKVINYNILSKDQVIEKPTKKGFNFLGWTGEDLTEATMDLVVPKGSTGDREYTATWEEAPTNTLAIALGVGIPGGAILIAGVVLIVLAKQKKIKLW